MASGKNDTGLIWYMPRMKEVVVLRCVSVTNYGEAYRNMCPLRITAKFASMCVRGELRWSLSQRVYIHDKLRWSLPQKSLTLILFLQLMRNDNLVMLFRTILINVFVRAINRGPEKMYNFAFLGRNVKFCSKYQYTHTHTHTQKKRFVFKKHQIK